MYDLEIGPIIIFSRNCKTPNISEEIVSSNESDIKDLIYGKFLDRLELFKMAYIQVSKSPLIGLGPGALTYNLDNKFSLGRESHNSFIDLTLYVGFVGLIIYSLLLISILIKSVKRKNILIFGSILALVMFSMFHNILRHPIYWISFLLLLNYLDNKNTNYNNE